MTTSNISVNGYGTPVSTHVCESCGVAYTVCPPAAAEGKLSKVCMADDCASYDPDCDVDILFMSDEEISRQKPIVSIKMLQKRKDYLKKGKL